MRPAGASSVPRTTMLPGTTPIAPLSLPSWSEPPVSTSMRAPVPTSTVLPASSSEAGARASRCSSGSARSGPSSARFAPEAMRVASTPPRSMACGRSETATPSGTTMPLALSTVSERKPREA